MDAARGLPAPGPERDLDPRLAEEALRLGLLDYQRRGPSTPLPDNFTVISIVLLLDVATRIRALEERLVGRIPP